MCCLAALFTAGALNLLPFDNAPRSHGWPHPIDSARAAFADLGPMLAVGFVFAGTTCWYLTQKTGVHARRWPLALVAAAVGWFPLDGEQHGFVLLSGGAAFAAVVVAARGLSLAERRPTPWSRQLVAVLAVLVVALGGASVAYGTLHPLSAGNGGELVTTTLRAKGSTSLMFASWTLDALDVRLRTAGFERTQRVTLEPAQRVDCR